MNNVKTPFIIQGIGHGNLVEDYNGNWHILCLGFRQIHLWMPYHNLGRVVFLIPVQFNVDDWFTAGKDGTCDENYELEGDFVQSPKKNYTFENTDWNIEWCYIRHPKLENYELSSNKAVLHRTDISLDDTDSPTFIGIRQRDFKFDLSVDFSIDCGQTKYLTSEVSGGKTVHFSLLCLLLSLYHTICSISSTFMKNEQGAHLTVMV